MFYIPITLLAEGRHSRGVLVAEQTGGGAGEQARSFGGGRPAIPGLRRCGARGRGSQPRTRAASGLRPEALRPPARSWLTAAIASLKARPEAARKTPRWSAGRRAGPPVRGAGDLRPN